MGSVYTVVHKLGNEITPMAVYTKVSQAQLEAFLKNYGIGKLTNYSGITEGVENTNYAIETDRDRFILTLYEKRVDISKLPFFMGLMEHLNQNGVPCPLPIKDTQGEVIGKLSKKSATIVTFLEGKGRTRFDKIHLQELGTYSAKFHLVAQGYEKTDANPYSLKKWQSLFDAVSDNADTIKAGLAEEIDKELRWLTGQWDSIESLPKGTIHADLFPDNVFFQGDKLSGIIDFYFACQDTYMYELAICLNAWCFENNSRDFNLTHAKTLLKAYNSVKPISDAELDALPVLARGAALRFLLTRLYDWFNTQEGAQVKPKAPAEYLHKLRFHQQMTSYRDYAL